MKLRGPNGIQIELDIEDQDTPAMVYRGRYSASWDYAMSTGVLNSYAGTESEYPITAAEMKWLENQEDEVNRTFNVARSGNPDYS